MSSAGPTPKSLILDLLSTLGRRTAPVRSLVQAGRLFGMRENSLRVALARLLADELVERDGRGEYRLGARAQGVNHEVRAWRRIEDQHTPWSGDWIGVEPASLGGGSAGARRRRERALRFLGFRALGPALELRPANLVGGVEAVRQRLEVFGLESPGLVFVLSDLDAESDVRARGLWDGAALVEGYRRRRAELAESLERLPTLPRLEAMAESFRLGGAAIRQLVFDPLLPEPIVPAAERRALVDATRDYELRGRDVWGGWRLATGAESDCPADVRGTPESADWLIAAGNA